MNNIVLRFLFSILFFSEETKMQLSDDDSFDGLDSHDWNGKKTDVFDTELVQRAEMFSDKWVQLYKNPIHNDDGLSQIIGSTAIGGHHINRFNAQNSIVQHLNSHPDSIIERNKLILLDKKYFEFEASTCDEAEIVTNDSNEKDDIKKYTTVFDHSIIENDLDSNSLPSDQVNELVKPQLANNRIQGKPQIATSKKKKGRTKYRPLTCDEATMSSTANTRATVLAAPPGVKALQSPLNNPRRMDLSKNGNHSLQFRL